MPFVPVRRPQTEVAFIPRAYSQVKIDPKAYDRGGSAMQNLAQTFSSISKASQDADDKAQAQKERQDLLAAMANQARGEAVKNQAVSQETGFVTLLHGSPADSSDADQGGVVGYLDTRGADAVSGWPSVSQTLDPVRDPVHDNLDDAASERAQAADAYADPVRSAMLQAGEQHFQTETKRTQSQDAANRATLSQQNYAVLFKDPATAKLVWDTGRADAALSAFLDPDGQVTPRQAQARWDSGAHRAVVETLLRKKDLDGARAWAQEHRGTLMPDDQASITAELDHAQDIATADTVVEPLIKTFVRTAKTDGEGGKARISAATTPEARTDTAAGAKSGALVRPGSMVNDTDTPVRSGGTTRAAGKSVADGAYPFVHDISDLRPFAEIDREYRQTARQHGLTEDQQRYGQQKLEQAWAARRDSLREQRKQDITTATGLVDQGQTWAEMPRDLRTRLGASGQVVLQRYARRKLSLDPDDTSWEVIDDIACKSNDDFANRLLAQDRPWMSPALHQMMGQIQTLIVSSSMAERAQGLALLQGVRIGAGVLRAVPPAQRSPVLIDLVMGTTFQAVDNARQAGKVLTRAELQKVVAPYFYDARMAQTPAARG